MTNAANNIALFVTSYGDDSIEGAYIEASPDGTAARGFTFEAAGALRFASKREAVAWVRENTTGYWWDRLATLEV